MEILIAAITGFIALNIWASEEKECTPYFAIAVFFTTLVFILYKMLINLTW